MPRKPVDGVSAYDIIHDRENGAFPFFRTFAVTWRPEKRTDREGSGSGLSCRERRSPASICVVCPGTVGNAIIINAAIAECWESCWYLWRTVPHLVLEFNLVDKMGRVSSNQLYID